jgi:glucose/arabinose dehydrogenase
MTATEETGAAEAITAAEETTATEETTDTGETTAAEELTATQATTDVAEVASAPLAPLPDNTMVALEQIATGLTAPIILVPAPDESGRLFVVDQIGLIRLITPDGGLQEQPFLDVRDRMVTLNPGYDERGLLGLAFHPDYAENGRFFVYYSAPLGDGAPAGWDHTSHLAAFTAGDDPNQADPASEQIILAVDQPQGNHNGGAIAFGPDGYLYVALGDGGGADDTDIGHVDDWYAENTGGNGQDLASNLLGSILRIDINGGDPYAIPLDNPFAGQAGAEEIFAYGFRNPYFMSFDRESGELYTADAGQNLWEEVDLVVSGGNYGWNVKEATHCFNTATPNAPLDECPDATPEGVPLLDPIVEYAHISNPNGEGLGLVSVGGFVYRGSQIPALVGRYIFADWSTAWDRPDGMLFAATPAAEGLWSFQPLQIQGSEDGRPGLYLRGFGEDLEGELYVLASAVAGPNGETGAVYRLAPGQAP